MNRIFFWYFFLIFLFLLYLFYLLFWFSLLVQDWILFNRIYVYLICEVSFPLPYVTFIGTNVPLHIDTTYINYSSFYCVSFELEITTVTCGFFFFFSCNYDLVRAPFFIIPNSSLITLYLIILFSLLVVLICNQETDIVTLTTLHSIGLVLLFPSSDSVFPFSRDYWKLFIFPSIPLYILFGNIWVFDLSSLPVQGFFCFVAVE